jgi:acyl-coenzyme A synthetase/AMP-(fatty) acid ligase
MIKTAGTGSAPVKSKQHFTATRVKEVAAVAIPDDLVGNRIKAFVVPMDHNGLTVKELESHAAQKLPRYMVPESIEFRDELPKTSTGKINRPLLAKS